MKITRKSWRKSEIVNEKERRLRDGVDIYERCPKCRFQWVFYDYNECPICYRNAHPTKPLSKLPIFNR